MKKKAIKILTALMCTLIIIISGTYVAEAAVEGTAGEDFPCPDCGSSLAITTSENLAYKYNVSCAHKLVGYDVWGYYVVTTVEECDICGYKDTSTSSYKAFIECQGK